MAAGARYIVTADRLIAVAVVVGDVVPNLVARAAANLDPGVRWGIRPPADGAHLLVPLQIDQRGAESHPSGMSLAEDLQLACTTIEIAGICYTAGPERRAGSVEIHPSDANVPGLNEFKVVLGERPKLVLGGTLADEVPVPDAGPIRRQRAVRTQHLVGIEIEIAARLRTQQKMAHDAHQVHPVHGTQIQRHV